MANAFLHRAHQLQEKDKFIVDTQFQTWCQTLLGLQSGENSCASTLSYDMEMSFKKNPMLSSLAQVLVPPLWRISFNFHNGSIFMNQTFFQTKGIASGDSRSSFSSNPLAEMRKRKPSDDDDYTSTRVNRVGSPKSWL